MWGEIQELMGMSSSTVASLRNDSSVNDNIEGPRAGGPVPRRSFTPVQKLEHVAAYEAATTRGEGLYASQIAEWRTSCAMRVFSPAKRLVRGLIGAR